jgi:protocatechuate 3,4-dioxygenase beta subunit
MMHFDEHDHGLAFDLHALVKRRKMLGIIGASALVACGGAPGNGEPNKTATAADGTVCIKDPTETSGPFPADGTNRKGLSTVNVLTQSGVVREDIRTCFDGMLGDATGSPLTLVITLVDVSNSCVALAGRAIYIWHCDADGKYSIYDIEDRNYLRGVGITNDKGQVTFTTIFPGCYSGRWPHIHFEVFADQAKAGNGSESLLVSQFALPGDAAKAIYAEAPGYATSVSNFKSLSLASDGIFADNTPEQNAAMTVLVEGNTADGFTGRATVGILTA